MYAHIHSFNSLAETLNKLKVTYEKLLVENANHTTNIKVMKETLESCKRATYALEQTIVAQANQLLILESRHTKMEDLYNSAIQQLDSTEEALLRETIEHQETKSEPTDYKLCISQHTQPLQKCTKN
jgi:hemerythrin-like domain-containing protein